MVKQGMERGVEGKLEALGVQPVQAVHLLLVACFSFFFSCFSFVESLGLLFFPGFSCPLAMSPPPSLWRRNCATIAKGVSKTYSQRDVFERFYVGRVWAGGGGLLEFA